jgi:hypothetical protein
MREIEPGLITASSLPHRELFACALLRLLAATSPPSYNGIRRDPRCSSTYHRPPVRRASAGPWR